MFDMNSILAMIQEGTSAEDIAKSFADSLNAAIKADAEAKAKEAEIQKAKEQKRADARALMELTTEYLHKYYPDVEIEETDDDVDSFINIMDSVLPMLGTFTTAAGAMRNVMPKVEVKTYTGKDAEDVFKRFFQRHGI